MSATLQRPAWATSTRQLDEWQDIAFRREVANFSTEGEVVFAIEQDAEPGSRPALCIEVDGIRVAAFHDPGMASAMWSALMSAQDAFEGVVGKDSETCKVKCRPGVLDAFATALGSEDDVALASAVGFEAYQIERLRAGGRFARWAIIELADKIAGVGLRSGRSRAMNWLAVSAD